MIITHKILFFWKVIPPMYTKLHRMKFGSASKRLFSAREMMPGELHFLLPLLLSCWSLKIWAIIQPVGSAVLFRRELLGFCES